MSKRMDNNAENTKLMANNNICINKLNGQQFQRQSINLNKNSTKARNIFRIAKKAALACLFIENNIILRSEITRFSRTLAILNSRDMVPDSIERSHMYGMLQQGPWYLAQEPNH